MNKAFLIKELHDYGKFTILGVCLSRELAKKIVEKRKAEWSEVDPMLTTYLDTVVEETSLLH